MKVPFLDLKLQYESIKDEAGAALEAVMESCAFANGPFVSKFEEEFAAYCQCREAIAVGSGTAALWMTLIGLGIGEGDEVITVPNTFIATAEAISFCGATPVFVDIEEATHNMDPSLLEAAITPRTKAIIPVHLYGQVCDMDPIMEIARSNGLHVIEDACQAHGGEYRGKRAGSLADAGGFSFYPGKNLGAYGEGGAVVTNDSALAERLRMFRDHGQEKKYYHSIVGWNSRMDGFQGAILSLKLKHLPAWTDARRQHAQRYRELLADVDDVMTPDEASYAHHVYHVYAVRTKNRDEFIAALKERDVHCGIHYPVPIHLQDAYRDLGFGPGSFPVAESSASEVVSLPMFPELTPQQVETVCEEVHNLVASGVASAT